MSAKSKSIGKVHRKEFPRVFERFKDDHTYYVLDCRGHGWVGQQWEQRKTKEEALERAREISRLINTHGLQGIIHDEEARMYRTLKARCLTFGMTLGDVVEDWINFRATNMMNAMSKGVDHHAEEWFTAKKENRMKPLSEKTIHELQQTKRNLIAAFGDLPLRLVTKEKIEEIYHAWEAKGISRSTIRNNYGKMFKGFFQWCIRKEYLKINPAANIEVHVPQRQILIYKIAEVELICSRLRTEKKNQCLTPYVILSMLMGLRPNEAAQIGWNEINFETKQITVLGGLSKVRRNRHLDMPDNVALWLKPWVGKPIGGDGFTNFRKRLESVKRDLPEQADILRHTAISFWMGKYKDENKVSYLMGNSPDTIKEHYMQGVSEADSKKFFELAP